MYEYKAKLIKVVDGDTVDAMIDCGFSVFRKERIRLRGINAPESRTRDKEEKKLGLAAKARLKELLKGQDVELHCEKEKGKFGRVSGVLWVCARPTVKRDLNKQMVSEGHAREYTGGKRLPWV